MRFDALYCVHHFISPCTSFTILVANTSLRPHVLAGQYAATCTHSLCMREIYRGHTNVNKSDMSHMRCIHVCIYVYIFQAMAIQSHNCTCTHVTDCLCCYIRTSAPLALYGACMINAFHTRINPMQTSENPCIRNTPKYLNVSGTLQSLCLSLPSHINIHISRYHGKREISLWVICYIPQFELAVRHLEISHYCSLSLMSNPFSCPSYFT